MGLHRFGELDPTVVVVVKATAAASWLRTVGLSNRPLAGLGYGPQCGGKGQGLKAAKLCRGVMEARQGPGRLAVALWSFT